MSTDENNSDSIEVFQDGDCWVARHKDFVDYSGAGDTAEEALFELMTVLENLQPSLDDEVC